MCDPIGDFDNFNRVARNLLASRLHDELSARSSNVVAPQHVPVKGTRVKAAIIVKGTTAVDIEGQRGTAYGRARVNCALDACLDSIIIDVLIGHTVGEDALTGDCSWLTPDCHGCCSCIGLF